MSLKKCILLMSESDLEVLSLLDIISISSDNELLTQMLFHSEEHVRSVFEEEWLSRYVEYDFFLLFRLKRETCDNLLSAIMCPELRICYVQHPVTPVKAILMTLWWLGRGEVLNSIADRFNIVPSTVFEYTQIVVERLCQLKNIYIQWPNANEAATVRGQFEAICGFPGVMGAIDGCNINIKAPVSQQESYIDKNNNHSIKLQAVATANHIFTNINVGFGGSVHDARVFRNSTLYRDISENGNLRKYFSSDEYHLAGDKAYPLLPWLMTPFKDYGNLEHQERRYNTFHSRTRIKIEHTFGILKQRFRILYYINVNNPIKAVKIIVACCVLHNFAYTNSDEWPGNLLEDINNNNDNEGYYYEEVNNVALIKRRNISLLF